MRRATAPAPLAAMLFAAATAAAVAASVANAQTRTAARFGCEAKTLTRVSTPHVGVRQAHCRDSLVLRLRRVDSVRIVKLIG